MSLGVPGPFVAARSNDLNVAAGKPHGHCQFTNDFVGADVYAVRGRVSQHQDERLTCIQRPVDALNYLQHVLKVTGNHQVVALLSPFG